MTATMQGSMNEASVPLRSDETSTDPHPAPPPPGVMFGTVCRVNFWIKMTTALGVTQIVIGVSCMVFYSVAYFIKILPHHLVAYVSVGTVAGGVILAAGLVGSVASKRKTKFTICVFLVLSAMAGLFALFPLVLGIVGATNPNTDESSLLMPICELVFATVEIVVATWSVGVCCQALCCPNVTFGQVSSRLPSGLGVTQFLSSGDGQHVVLFTSPQTHVQGLMLPPSQSQVPYIIQQGIPAVQLSMQPNLLPHSYCSIARSTEKQDREEGVEAEKEGLIDRAEHREADYNYGMEDEAQQLLC